MGVKLAQLLHQATTKITPKIRRKRAGRGPNRSGPKDKRSSPSKLANKAPGTIPSRAEGLQQAPSAEAEEHNDQELEDLLEAEFAEYGEEEQPPSAKPARGRASAAPATNANTEPGDEEGHVGAIGDGQHGYADGDGDGDEARPEEAAIPGMDRLMGFGLGIDFTQLGSHAGEDFDEGIERVRLPAGAQKALDRDNARRKRRHVAQIGWDNFQVVYPHTNYPHSCLLHNAFWIMMSA